MKGKIILALLILFYQKEEVKAKKLTKNEKLLMNEDLIFYENEPKYNVKRQVNFNLEFGSGLSEEPTTLFGNTTFFSTITDQTTLFVNPCDSNPCASNTTCLNLGDVYECECNEGFVYNNVQTSCQDKDECALNISNCGENEKCVNTIGSFKCICADGYELVNNVCEQITSETPSTQFESEIIETTETTTTPIPIVPILGQNDVSLKNLSLIGNDQSYEFTSPNVSLNILGSSFNSFRVQPNGFVSFSGEAPNLIQDPPGSIKDLNFPIIAPFWSNSIIDDQSDIKFGTYQENDMDQNLLEKIRGLLNRPSKRRSVSLDVFDPELIYSITWEDLKESTISDKRATFQLFITTSFTQETSYAIFNYIKIDWTEFDQEIVFIGLTDGKNSITNPFTSNNDVSGKPSLITSQPGNTGKNGVYIYKLEFADEMTIEIRETTDREENETTFSTTTSSTSTRPTTLGDVTTENIVVETEETETTLSTTTSSTSTRPTTLGDETTEETETTLSTTTSSSSTRPTTLGDETTEDIGVETEETETTFLTTTSSTSTRPTTLGDETTEETETTLSTTTSSTSTRPTTLGDETTEETETTLSTTTSSTSTRPSTLVDETTVKRIVATDATESSSFIFSSSPTSLITSSATISIDVTTFEETPTSTTSTTSTTTTFITATSTTTTTTTRIPIVPILGPNDNSLRIGSLIGDVQSYQFFSSTVNLNILGSTYNSFRIYPNGFVSFGSQAPNSIRNPTFSIDNFNFPIIAPLWSNSIFDNQSDVKFGIYQGANIDPTFLRNIRRLLNPASASRAVSLDVYDPELIYSITWEDLKESATSDKRATFQLFITISFSQETSYAIFNYVKVDWTQFNQQFVFIGLTDGKRSRTNRFSANGDVSGNPSLITNQPGNTGQNGVFVYDLNYVVVDQCTRLLNQKILNKFQPATQQLNFFMICPLTDFAMSYNPYFTEFRGRKWQNSKCYKLKWNSFYRYIIQQLCCYDLSSRNLIFFGRNSGFAYNAPAVEPIMSEGNQCCAGTNWNNCRRFYTLYPPTLLSLRQILFIFGWGGGDPHLTTFDDYSYTFNGLGKFMFSRAKDNSFQIQGLTSILANINGSSDLSGTLFTSFAMKTSRSQTFQIDLVDGDKARPYLALHIDKQEQTEPDFSLNFAYQKDFACVDQVDELCTTIIQSENGVQFLFENGLSLTFSVTMVTVSQVESRSWITCSVNFLNNDRFDYQGNLEGLMGNWNGNKTDDIAARDGSEPQGLTDRQIYDTMVTWAITSQEDLFTANTVSRTIGRIRGSRQSTYRPVFLENLDIDPRINQSCNANVQCIFDATASGLTQVGEQTLEGVRVLETSITETRLSPPAVLFANNKTELNWNSDQLVTISVQVTDTNSFEVQLDTANIDVQRADLGSGLSRTINIEFKPIQDQLPKIGIIAKDDTNLTTTIYYSQFFICKCQSLSEDNECKYDVVQEAIENTGVYVACECDNYHEGIYCDKVRNECETGRVCDREGSFGQTCEPLSVQEQKSTGRGFRCIGDCPSGYEKDEFGACKDILECSQVPNVCKDGSTCFEKPGSFECVCRNGYRYVNDLCEMIDYCKTTANDCDQICSPVENGVECSCIPGFVYNQTAKECIAENIVGCDTFGCSQLCGTSSDTPQCFCEKGYELEADGKTCKDINECLNNNGNCPNVSTCQNTPGSYSCQCQVGTKFDLNTFRCVQCSERTYGNNCEQTCQCTSNFVKCDPIVGCICEPGFDGIDCLTEVNACEGFTNTTIQSCVSRFGQRVITCSLGFEIGEDGNCTKIDYCNPNPCNSQTNCTSLDLNFTCTCEPGFEYNYITTVCDDIAECSTVQCPLNSRCVELPGSYNCRCNSGFENKNMDPKLPQCEDINECEQNSFVCASNRKCRNTIGDYECICDDGFEEINELCVQITTTTTSTSSTVSTAVSQDNTGLILVIVLPIIAVLILSVIAGLICFCWYRKSAGSLANRKKVPNIVEERAGVSGLNQRSMFEKKDVATEPDLINFDENAEGDRDGFEDGSSGSHSTYRPSYLFDKTDNVDVFKALEENARSSQKKTIGRPQSLFTGSSFSVPTAYHETTTPYGDFAGDRIRQEQGLSENDIKYFMNDEDTFDAFDNDDDLDEIIEAFNPNVKIPRPKIQLNPLKIFKFGNKNAESEN